MRDPMKWSQLSHKSKAVTLRSLCAYKILSALFCIADMHFSMVLSYIHAKKTNFAPFLRLERVYSGKRIINMRIKKIHFTLSFLSLAFFFSCSNSSEEAKSSFEKGENLVLNDKKWTEGGEQLLHSLSLQNEEKPTDMLVKTYYYLSRVYWEQDFTDKALAYAQKAMACSEGRNDTIRTKIINRVASCYYLMNKCDSAYYYYNKVLDTSLKQKDSINILNAYNNIGALRISESKFDEAISFFEKGQTFSKHRRSDDATYHYNLSRCYQNMGRWEECAREIKLSMMYCDTTNAEAVQKLYRRLYFSEKNRNNLAAACNAADSTFLLSDSVFRMKQREELKGITEKYQAEKYESELALQRTHWLLVVADVILVSVALLFFIMYRNKKRMEKLQKRTENLKIQVIREEQERDKAEENHWNAEKEENLSHLYLEQFKVSRDIFLTRPAYKKLSQLKYHTDKNYLPDEVRMPLIDSILEVFIDQLQKLRINYPELTEDECLYAVLIYVGCNNATASMLTKTSEATLRKRRSRFKQKTNEQVFNLLFN